MCKCTTSSTSYHHAYVRYVLKIKNDATTSTYVRMILRTHVRRPRACTFYFLLLYRTLCTVYVLPVFGFGYCLHINKPRGTRTPARHDSTSHSYQLHGVTYGRVGEIIVGVNNTFTFSCNGSTITVRTRLRPAEFRLWDLQV